MHQLTSQLSDYSVWGDLTTRSSNLYINSIAGDHSTRIRASIERFNAIAERAFRSPCGWLSLAEDARAYGVDRAQRLVLYTDSIRERGDIFLAHEAAGCPPVLIYDYEAVMDGADPRAVAIFTPFGGCWVSTRCRLTGSSRVFQAEN